MSAPRQTLLAALLCAACASPTPTPAPVPPPAAPASSVAPAEVAAAPTAPAVTDAPPTAAPLQIATDPYPPPPPEHGWACVDLPVKTAPAPHVRMNGLRAAISDSLAYQGAGTGGGGAGLGAPAASPAPPPAPAKPAESVATAASSRDDGADHMAAPEAERSAAEPAAGPMGKAKAEKKGSASASASADAPLEIAVPPKDERRAARRPADKKPLVMAETFPDTPTTRYLSADDSNSTASPVVVRQLIRAGRYVPPAVVRTYEFLNQADFDYPPPGDGTLAVVPEMRPTGKPGEYSLQVAVRAPERALAAMSPLNVTLLLDVSGSMAGMSATLAGQFIRGFVGRLRPGDRLSFVTVSRNPAILLENHVVGAETPAGLQSLLVGLAPSDVTNLDAGLTLAYDVAQRTYDPARLNRVVLISDGAANAGKLSKKLIAERAKDSERAGIYLAGVGLGQGFDDSLMNLVTDQGRGAYLFLDSEAEVQRALEPRRFVATFDVAARDVRLKMVLPPRWKVREFHGEQISAVQSDVIPQYLGPNDQMLYHMTLATDLPEVPAGQPAFAFEAEFALPGGPPNKVAVERGATDMLAGRAGLPKADALVAYAEALKQMKFPLEPNRTENVRVATEALAKLETAAREKADPELVEALQLLATYRRTLAEGEASEQACDRQLTSPAAVLGLDPGLVLETLVRGDRPKRAVAGLEQLRTSTRLRPQEGHRFLAISSGPVGSGNPNGSGELGERACRDPAPKFMGLKRGRGPSGEAVYDLHQVTLTLRAPADANSFSFDFNYFSAEYPEFVQQDYNDTFYAILEAPSTNGGATTNISFDPNRRSIEVDNNYFQNKFHPIPNTGTGFDRDGSTGWLRTSWPIEPGEKFKLTFSVHDEGDGIYDSLVLVDNFRFHAYEAVGSTDPLN